MQSSSNKKTIVGIEELPDDIVLPLKTEDFKNLEEKLFKKCSLVSAAFLSFIKAWVTKCNNLVFLMHLLRKICIMYSNLVILRKIKWLRQIY